MTFCGAVRTFPGAKRLECVELAPAFESPLPYDSASKLDALQTLRVTAMPIFSYVSVFRAAHTKPHPTENSAKSKTDEQHPENQRSTPQIRRFGRFPAFAPRSTWPLTAHAGLPSPPTYPGSDLPACGSSGRSLRFPSELCRFLTRPSTQPPIAPHRGSPTTSIFRAAFPGLPVSNCLVNPSLPGFRPSRQLTAEKLACQAPAAPSRPAPPQTKLEFRIDALAFTP